MLTIRGVGLGDFAKLVELREKGLDWRDLLWSANSHHVRFAFVLLFNKICSVQWVDVDNNGKVCSKPKYDLEKMMQIS